MDANVVRQLNRLKKEAESIEKFNFDKFERLLKKYNSANSDVTNYDICKTLRGIRLAVEHQNHSDNDVKRKAAKVIKSAGHSIENVKISLRPFRTVLDIVELLEVGKTSTPKCFQLDHNFRLIEVVSIPQLQKMGRTFGNCVKCPNFAAEYFRNMKSESSTIWVLFRRSTPVAMINVNLESQVIDDFEFASEIDQDKTDDYIDYALLMKILQTLDVSADNVGVFIARGAFKKFVNGRPSVIPVSVDDSKWLIFFYVNELIIGEYSKTGELKWSCFKYLHYHLKLNGTRRPVSGWIGSSNNHLSLNQLFETVRRNPQLLDEMQISLAGESIHTPQIQESDQLSLSFG